MISTFPNEAVTCQLANGRKRRLFIKYEARHPRDAFGHRGGVAYEAEIYRRLLHHLPNFRPRFFGAHTDRDTCETRLILEYVDRAVRVKVLVQQFQCAYQRARWPEGAPAGFQHTLDSARIYLQFRWLGEQPDRTTDKKILWRFVELTNTAVPLLAN